MGNLKINNDLLDLYVKKTDYIELQAENERLKEELKKQVKNNKTAYQVELDTYNMECGNLLEENKNLIEENERLKEELRTERIHSSQIEELEESLQHAKAENERLKEENYQLQKDCQICENFIDFIPCKPIRDMDYDLQKVISQRDNYYQALQEIREIAEKEIVCEDCNFEGTDKCDARMCTHFYLNDFSKDILAKINEVIGAK